MYLVAVINTVISRNLEGRKGLFGLHIMTIVYCEGKGRWEPGDRN